MSSCFVALHNTLPEAGAEVEAGAGAAAAAAVVNMILMQIKEYIENNEWQPLVFLINTALPLENCIYLNLVILFTKIGRSTVNNFKSNNII